jgi:hypothetical protein
MASAPEATSRRSSTCSRWRKRSDTTPPMSLAQYVNVAERRRAVLETRQRTPSWTSFSRASSSSASAPAIATARAMLARSRSSASSSSLGLSRLDAECYRRELDGLSQTLYVQVQVQSASLFGWLERPCPGGVLERFLRAELTLGPRRRRAPRLSAVAHRPHARTLTRDQALTARRSCLSSTGLQRCSWYPAPIASAASEGRA